MTKKQSWHVQLVVKPEIKRLLEKAAARANLPLATWVRVVAVNEAQKTKQAA
jgi:uncharacterized protein (DUF1778 family)